MIAKALSEENEKRGSDEGENTEEVFGLLPFLRIKFHLIFRVKALDSYYTS